MRTPVSLWISITILMLVLVSGPAHADDSQTSQDSQDQQQQAQQPVVQPDDPNRWTDSWDPCAASDYTAQTACQAQKDAQNQYGNSLTLTGDETQDGSFDDGAGQ